MYGKELCSRVEYGFSQGRKRVRRTNIDRERAPHLRAIIYYDTNDLNSCY